MNNWKAALALTVLIGLYGCTTTYQHPTKSNQQWYADYSECEARAGQAAGLDDAYGVRRKRVLESCLLGFGWHPVDVAQRDENSRLTPTPATAARPPSSKQARDVARTEIGAEVTDSVDEAFISIGKTRYFDCLRDVAIRRGLDATLFAGWMRG